MRLEGSDITIQVVSDPAGEGDPPTSKRIVGISEGFMWHVDEADPESPVVSGSIPCASLIQSVGDLGQLQSPNTYSNGQGLIWITDGLNTCLVSVGVDSINLVWTSEDFSLPNTYGFYLIGVANGLAYLSSEWQEVGTVTDVVRFSNAAENWGEPYDSIRTEPNTGHSYKRGIVAVNAFTGAYVGRLEWGGDPIFYDYRQGPRIDTLFTNTFSYTMPRGERTIDDPDNPGETLIIPGPVASLHRYLIVPNYAEWFYKVDLYPHDEHTLDDTANPYLMEGLPPGASGGSFYSPYDPASAPVLATIESIKSDFIDYQAAWVNDACDARLIGTERARSFRVQVNLPQYVLQNDSDDLTFMDLTYDSILGIQEPQTLPDEPAPRMGAFWGSDMRNLNSLRRFPVWPRVPQDDTLVGQMHGGVLQRWAYPEEYKPFIGSPDLGPFEGLYSYEAGDDYEGSYSFSGQVGDGAEGATVNIMQSVIWEGRADPDEITERQITPYPPYSAYAAFDGTNHIHGPLGGEDTQGETPTLRTLTWRQRTALAWNWTTTYPTPELAQAGRPIPLNVKRSPEAESPEILYFTFVNIGEEWRCIILDMAGELVADPETPANMLNPTYDGKVFKQNGVKWANPI